MAIVFVDIEASGGPDRDVEADRWRRRDESARTPSRAAIFDYGACDLNGAKLHTRDIAEFGAFLRDKGVRSTNGFSLFRRFRKSPSDTREACDFICGHNIIDFDLPYIQDTVKNANISESVDTLYLWPLLFPERKSYALPKDDKISPGDFSNPLNDAMKAMELFQVEVSAFLALPDEMKGIFCSLLCRDVHFRGFFRWLDVNGKYPSGVMETEKLAAAVRENFRGRICAESSLSSVIPSFPVELAYCLAFINAGDHQLVIPEWVRYRFPETEKVMRILRGTPCSGVECSYCREHFSPEKWLKNTFGYESFRTYDGEPLQERAVKAAIAGESVLTIFPTGGGKSLTFQLPAIMQGAAEGGLTVVISPLQALMKDQVDNLEKQGVIGAVTINGMLDPIDRASSVDRVMNGSASMLYISPESLRSKTVKRLLMRRTVVRFVIDEAHCFSAWGQDFRVDYQYIGKFIAELSREKGLDTVIPVSCFTATARQKVISDIRSYFRETCGLQLSIYAASSVRENLRYEVVYAEDEGRKYSFIRDLISSRNCPTIVYVSTVKKTEQIAEHLCQDFISAVPFNGRMERQQKIENQEKFIENEVNVIVATSAFGMGVDKSDIELVIHYDIAGSLEDYVQEAGRAGRDRSINADCYILYNNDDLQDHFNMLNRTKLSISMIQQVWSAIKRLTGRSPYVSRSALEFAKEAGWDTSKSLPGETETRVKAAINALEIAGYVCRGDNMPHVYANSIKVNNVSEAAAKMRESGLFNDKEEEKSRAIVSSLLSESRTFEMRGAEAESRVDYLADRVGETRDRVISYIYKMRRAGILKDDKDLTMYINSADLFKKAGTVLKRYVSTETFMLSSGMVRSGEISIKQLNEDAHDAGVRSSKPDIIKKILNFWALRGYIKKLPSGRDSYVFEPETGWEKLTEHRNQCNDAAKTIIDYLSDIYKAAEKAAEDKEDGEKSVPARHSEMRFSVKELTDRYNMENMFQVTPGDIEEALLYLSKTNAMNIDGGFLVIYNSMRIERLELDNRRKYKKSDYEELNEYYKNRIRQIHIVGKFARTMASDYEGGLQFVSDYFHMEFRDFVDKYYDKAGRMALERSITPEKYREIAGELSETQRKILDDNQSKYIAVIAGPGSGKTKVLVHKLASLCMLEDVKQEQLLMLTFSRSAAAEFRDRLRALIGSAAYYIEIKTFHSYALDLIGEVGSLEKLDHVVAEAASMIEEDEVEPGRVAKNVVVIDEAQDMDEDEYLLVRALMKRNEGMRVIAVGDDDQNIYEFRGSDSGYLESLITELKASKYEMLDDYRSRPAIVALANAFGATIQNRLKEHPIRSMRVSDKDDDPGRVEIIRHTSENMEIPLADQLMAAGEKESVCVLTNTNAEAAQITGLLNRRGVKAELIQSNDGFDLYDIAEIRYFLGRLRDGDPLISDETWDKALEKTGEVYRRSTCMPVCRKILKSFADYNRSRYRSDLEVFLHESKLEDFSGMDSNGRKHGRVLVSTIHKSKGREFDSVCMMLRNTVLKTDADRRRIYVGITRARDSLYIHCNNGILDGMMSPDEEAEAGIVRKFDGNLYDRPDEIVMQLSHHDVNLGFFKNERRKRFILRCLQSGDRLELNGEHLYAAGMSRPVAKLSKKASGEVADNISQGYRPDRAEIRFIVSWHDPDEDAEYAVILPDLYMKKDC